MGGIFILASALAVEIGFECQVCFFVCACRVLWLSQVLLLGADGEGWEVCV